MLEHRYRTLLRWYPADYRKEYGEEIITVLLGTARPGQRRPGIRDTADLLRGGLTVRLRLVRHDLTEPKWQDALALVSLLIPVTMLAFTCRYFADAAMILPFALEHAGGVFEPGGPEGSPTWHTLFASAPFWATWGVLSVLALLGARRAAAVGMLAVCGGMVAAGLVEAFGGRGLSWSEGTLAIVTAGLVAGGSLLFSPGPRRGRELLGRLPFVAVIVGAALLGVVTARQLMLRLVDGHAWTLLEAGVVLYGVLLTALLVGRAHGRRAWALLLLACSPPVLSPAVAHGDPVLLWTTLVVGSVLAFVLVVGANRVVERRFAAARQR